MLREHQKLIQKIHLFLDVLCLSVAWGVSYLVLTLTGFELATARSYFPALAIFVFFTMAYLSLRRFRPEEHFGSAYKILSEPATASFFGLFSLGFIFYFLNLKPISRPFLFLSGMFSLLLLSAWNFLVRLFYKKIRAKGMNYQHLLLVGNRYTLPPVIRAINKNPALGQKIEAVLWVDEQQEQGEATGLKVFSGLEKTDEILNQQVIDNALFTVYRQDPIGIEQAILKCQERGVDVWLKPDFMHGMLISRVDYLADIPLFIFSLGPKDGAGLVLKRFFDIISSFFLLTIIFPSSLLIALLIKTTPGPIFFLQKRVGLNGRRFLMAKFRTMYKDAEQRKAEYNLKNEMQGPVFKMKNDPRVTPIGRFLRKYSLDELPQLWSVLKGDMSLVGPRPPLPCEVDLYQGWQRRRLSMRPGITCIWQVSGRNKITDFNEWARLDLRYIDEWTPFLDLKILMKTIPEVFKGTGL